MKSGHKLDALTRWSD